MDEQGMMDRGREPVRPCVGRFRAVPFKAWLAEDLDEGYRDMAEDLEREAEATEWVEGTAEDVVD